MELNVIKQKIGELRANESGAKALIAELVVATVDRIHEHNEVDSANNFLLALSPLNKKKVESFLKKHSGHKFEQGMLGKRAKDYIKDGKIVSAYTECKDAFDAFKGSGMDFWQWVNLKNKASKDESVTLDVITKRTKKAVDAIKEGLEIGIIDRTMALQLLIGDVMSQDDLMQGLSAMFKAEAAVSKVAMAATVVKHEPAMM